MKVAVSTGSSALYCLETTIMLLLLLLSIAAGSSPNLNHYKQFLVSHCESWQDSTKNSLFLLSCKQKFEMHWNMLSTNMEERTREILLVFERIQMPLSGWGDLFVVDLAFCLQQFSLISQLRDTYQE